MSKPALKQASTGFDWHAWRRRIQCAPGWALRHWPWYVGIATFASALLAGAWRLDDYRAVGFFDAVPWFISLLSNGVAWLYCIILARPATDRRAEPPIAPLDASALGDASRSVDARIANSDRNFFGWTTLSLAITAGATKAILWIAGVPQNAAYVHLALWALVLFAVAPVWLASARAIRKNSEIAWRGIEFMVGQKGLGALYQHMYGSRVKARPATPYVAMVILALGVFAMVMAVAASLAAIVLAAQGS